MNNKICKICRERPAKHYRTVCGHCFYVYSDKRYPNNPRKANTNSICQTCGLKPARRCKGNNGKIYLGKECNSCVFKKDKRRYTGEGKGGKMKLLGYKKMVSERFKGENNPNYGKPSPSRGKPNLKNAGSNSWNWKGGITKERPSEERAWWRTGVYKRDKYICNKCGQGGKLNAHHVMHYNNYPDLRQDINNGVTLCMNCHRDYHKIFGHDSTDLQPYLFFLWQQGIVKKAA